MKRTFIVLVICAAVLVCAVCVSKPVIIWFAKAQLRGIFVGSTVSIGDCTILPTRLIAFSGIAVSRGSIYSLEIKEVRLSYDIFSLIRGAVKKVSIKDAAVSFNMGQKSISRVSEYIHIKPGKSIAIKKLELTNARIEIKAKEVRCAAVVSCGIDLSTRRPEYVRLTIDSLESQGVFLEGLTCAFGKTFPEGEFSLKELRYDKFKIKEITGSPRFKGETIFLDALSAKVLDGKVEGSVAVALTKTATYTGKFELAALSLAAFVDEFDLKEKLELIGRLSGTVSFAGDTLHLKALSGSFLSLEPGGTLSIKDTKMLEEVARQQSAQTNPLAKGTTDIFIEGFKNYHYNRGSIRAALEQKNLLLGISLDGEAGKRDLQIVVHDFNVALTRKLR